MSVKQDLKITAFLAKSLREEQEAAEKAAEKAEKAKLVEAWLKSLTPPERYTWLWRARRQLPVTESQAASLAAFSRR